MTTTTDDNATPESTPDQLARDEAKAARKGKAPTKARPAAKPKASKPKAKAPAKKQAKPAATREPSPVTTLAAEMGTSPKLLRARLRRLGFNAPYTVNAKLRAALDADDK
jgi:hypothetical protein